MSLVSWTFPVVLFHDLIEISSRIFTSLGLDLLKKLGELILDGLRFLIQVGTTLGQISTSQGDSRRFLLLFKFLSFICAIDSSSRTEIIRIR